MVLVQATALDGGCSCAWQRLVVYPSFVREGNANTRGFGYGLETVLSCSVVHGTVNCQNTEMLCVTVNADILIIYIYIYTVKRR
jgi:hypothetical protein